MDESEVFIEKFHTLEGTLLKDRKKSLFTLLENHKSLHDKEEILKKINENLQPKTYLEEVYKVEVLIYFKMAAELFEILKNGSEISCSKIIKQPWFLTSLFDKITPQEFVQNIFPKLSIVVRSKILKQMLKVHKDEEFINSLFEELFEVYGLKPALILLPGCSTEKIDNFLKERTPALSKPLLKLLYDKYPSFVLPYYQTYHTKGGKMSYLAAFTLYLKKKDPNLYVKLLHKYNLEENTLGRKTTKKFIQENREAILKDPIKYRGSRYSGLLKKDAVAKNFGDAFSTFLKSVFPKQLTELTEYSDVHNYLRYYPKKKRYQLYFETFQNVYKKSLYDNKVHMTEKLLEVIPDHEEREKWVDIFENELNYIQYKRSTVAIPELKEHLFRCDDINLRINIFKYLITTCSISKDYDGLLDILKIVRSRYKNTDSAVLSSFLEELYTRIELEDLSDEHWKYIHEIIMVQNIRNLTIIANMVLEYCKFLYKSGLPFEDMIPIWLKADYLNLESKIFINEKFRDENFKYEFLSYIVKHYSNAKTIKESSFTTSEIVKVIRDWNKKHPKKLILVSKQKDIVDAIKKGVDVTYLYYGSEEMAALKYLICRENCLDDFQDIYFERIDCLQNESVTNWILKYKPDVLKEEMKNFVTTANKKNRRGLKLYLKKYEHSGLVKMIVEHCLEKLVDPEEVKRDEIAQILALVMPKMDYLKLLEKYIPIIDKIDVVNSNEEERTQFQIQLALAKSIRHTTNRADILPILLKYCRGDVFQAALISLYSCFNYVPETNLKPIFESLLEKPITVRKHAIFLAAMAFSLNDNIELGNKILNSDPSNSIQKHLFTSSYKFFLKNPLEQVWTIVEKYMDHLTFHEKETLDLLTNVHVVPEKYRGKCANKVWETFENIEDKEKKPMTKFYNDFMRNMCDDDMRFLTEDLCIKIINSKVCQEKYKRNEDCTNFAIKFMIYGNGSITKNVSIVLNCIKKYKDDYWNTDVSHSAKSQIYKFCSAVFEKAMNKRDLRVFFNKEFTQIFREQWKTLFTINETFEEYLMLDFMCLKYGDSKDLKFFANEINLLFQSIRNIFGDLVIGIFQRFLEKSVISLLGQKNYELKLMKLLANMLEEESSVPSCLLVVQLLPVRQADDEFRNNFEYVVNKLQDKPEIVQVHLNSYYKNESDC